MARPNAWKRPSRKTGERLGTGLSLAPECLNDPVKRCPFPAARFRCTFLCAVLATVLLPNAFAGANATTYTFGVVPQFDQRRIMRIWQPILNELQRRTGLHFELKVTPAIPVFEKELLRGDYDFAYLNPYHMLIANKTGGYEPLVRDIGRQLSGIVVVRKDSRIQSVKGLEGKTVAFPAPNSVGASLVVRADLRNRFGIRITPKYVKTHTSVYLNVITGLADAGGGVQRTLDMQAPEIRDVLRVLYRTRTFAPHPVAVNSRVPKADGEKVRQALLALADTAKGRALLGKVPVTQPGPAVMEDYMPLANWGLNAFYVPQ